MVAVLFIVQNVYTRSTVAQLSFLLKCRFAAIAFSLSLGLRISLADLLSSCSNLSVTISIFGTSSLASSAVTRTLYESGRLASKWTTRSSSVMTSQITDNSLKISVSVLIVGLKK